MKELLEQIAAMVERGKVSANAPFPPDLKDKEGVDELTKKAVDDGVEPENILNDGLVLGMMRIGEKFRANKVFVPDVLIAAKAMKAGLKHIEPFFLSQKIKLKGNVVIGTVSGDLHDIGKNIVGMIIQGGGWNIVDLGIDVNAQKFIDAVNENGAKAVCLSALLTTTMVNMKQIISDIKKEIPEVKVLVGGAPLTQKFADDVNADFYSNDPQGALEYLNEHCRD